MTDPAETKVCPLCAETIKAAAKVCPFCRARQSRFVRSWYEFAGAIMGLFFIVSAIVILAWFSPDEEGVGGRHFSRHRNDLVVLGPALSQTKSSSELWLSGYVTNQGAYPWRVDELEVRFVDRQRRLLDVLHPEVKDRFVVLPGRDHAFRIALRNLIFTNSEVAPQVRVQMASDGDRPLKRD